MSCDRAMALHYVSFGVDDALAVYGTGDAMQSAPMPNPIPGNAVLVGWQCGFEPLFVAVWSYLPGVALDADDAVELATDLLQERKWFTDNDNPPNPDYVIEGAQS
jgi:hypothetical protein